MRNLVVTQPFDDLVAQHRNAGGVVDFVFFEIPDGIAADELHEAAAKNAMRIFEEPLSVEEKLESYATSKGAPYGELIDWKTFLGPLWDTQTNSIDKNQSGNILPGFAYAFLMPPYGSGNTESNPQIHIFKQFLSQVLNSGENLEIFSWNTDWSDYFQAGHEWWGAFFWTIRVNDSYILTIGASTTD